MKEWFRKFASKVAYAAGTPVAFATAIAIIGIWAATGHFFHYSDTWQLIINTGTTIVTFLMVFLIQNSQNRDSRIIHLKLDELIRGVKGARSELVDMECMDDAALEKLQEEFRAIHQRLNDQIKERALHPEEAAKRVRPKNPKLP